MDSLLYCLELIGITFKIKKVEVFKLGFFLKNLFDQNFPLNYMATR